MHIAVYFFLLPLLFGSGITAPRSPFTGMALDTAVWQWSATVPSAISFETRQPVTAWLWVPPSAKRLRGVVVGPFNMLERPIMEHPAFRDAMARLGYGCIWIAPSFFGSQFNFRNPDQSNAMTDVFATLARVSGYGELTNVPFVGLGHSAMSDFPYQLAAWNPSRAVAGISYDGTSPGVEYNYSYGSNKILDEPALRTLEGIPFLIRDGEYSGGRNSRRPTVVLSRFPGLCLSMVSDPGSGHFDVNERIPSFLTDFIARADSARRATGADLKPIRAADGWYADYWQVDQGPRVPPAHSTLFRGVVGPYGEEKIWTFDESHARLLNSYQSYQNGRKVQLLAYVQTNAILPDRMDHAQVHPTFLPEEDGLSFPLRGAFLDTVTKGRATRWSGKNAGDAIPHGGDPEKIRIDPVCGPVIRLDGEMMAVRFDRYGFNGGRRSGEVYLIASHPGDGVYRRSVLQSTLMVPTKRALGFPQKINFPIIVEQKFEKKALSLAATSDSGLPVEFSVIHGPAWIKDGTLYFTEIPAGARRPVEVKIMAWQYGRVAEPKVQSADPVIQTFHILD